ncbi:hypothetical protein RIF29_21159 [Crotalaria pallida]|uniref:Uncharacterized protein n=1 Tax=Crotalaria pallida TaxID=3830 RepID=A0AAN9F4T4_CROPI
MILLLLKLSEKNEALGEHQRQKFKDIQKLIADKLERSKAKKEAIIESFFVKTPLSIPATSHGITESSTIGRKSPSFDQLFRTMKNQIEKKDSKGYVNHQKPVAISAHSSIVGEIQNHSAHLLAIRADIETKGEFINDLIKKVVDAAYKDIEDVLKFVDWLDVELSSLVGF